MENKNQNSASASYTDKAKNETNNADYRNEINKNAKSAKDKTSDSIDATNNTNKKSN